jgi:hypothetical protein
MTRASRQSRATLKLFSSRHPALDQRRDARVGEIRDREEDEEVFELRLQAGFRPGPRLCHSRRSRDQPRHDRRNERARGSSVSRRACPLRERRHPELMGSQSSRTFSTARPAGSASTMNQLAPLLLGARFRRGHGRATGRRSEAALTVIPQSQSPMRQGSELKGKWGVALLPRVWRWSDRYEFCWSRMITSSESV